MRPARSSTATRFPRLPASIAHIKPAAPPPRMITSNSFLTISDVRAPVVRVLARVHENPREDRSQWRPVLPNADERILNRSHEAQPAQFDAQRLPQAYTCG